MTSSGTVGASRLFLLLLFFTPLQFLHFQAATLFGEVSITPPSYVDPTPSPVAWNLLGPLPGSISFDLSDQATSDGRFDSSRPVKTPDGIKKWRPVTGWQNNTFTYTDAPLSELASATLWFYTEVTATQPETFIWSYDGDDAFRIWINGRDSGQKPFQSGIGPWLFATSFTVESGVTPLLMRVDNVSQHLSVFSALHRVTDHQKLFQARKQLFDDLKRPENLNPILMLAELNSEIGQDPSVCGKIENWLKSLSACPFEKVRQGFCNIRGLSTQIGQREYAGFLNSLIVNTGCSREFQKAGRSFLKDFCQQRRITQNRVRRLFFQGQTVTGVFGTRLLFAAGFKDPELLILLLRVINQRFGRTGAWEDFMECSLWAGHLEKVSPGLGSQNQGIVDVMGGRLVEAIPHLRHAAEKLGPRFQTLLWLAIAMIRDTKISPPLAKAVYLQWKDRANKEDRLLFQSVVR